MRSRSGRVMLRDELVTLAHGAGGKATRDLVEAVFVEVLGNEALAALGDSAVVAGSGRVALTTDSFVVRPLEFPGGDIGELAVNGTVNDLAVSGARPRWLSAGFVIEEGFPIAELRRIAGSMADAARAAAVAVVAGDTKVVERGKADGLYITTAGLGVLPDTGVELGPERVRPGDAVLLSGPVGDHGMAVMMARGDLALEVDIESDTAPVHSLAGGLVALGDAVRFMRDPTRGGLATALNELAGSAGLGVRLQEAAIPVRPEVHAACEVLGIDPLHVANEGRLIAVVAPDAEAEALAALRAQPLGEGAVAIGRIEADEEALVTLDTALGGARIVDMLVGDPLPRIC